MCEFKFGDRVRLRSGNKFSNDEYTCEIRNIHEMYAYLEDRTLRNFNQLELAYPNQPHKHRDLIIEWANGADIQVESDNRWFDLPIPNWDKFRKYRVKPQKTERDIEIESIQKQMDELKERLEKLKGGES